jgi:hypothetical protein
MAFQMVWMVGLPWSLAFRFPSSIAALFLRRCHVKHATHVAITAPSVSIKVVKVSPLGQRLWLLIWTPIETFLNVLFSIPHNKVGYESTFCAIEFSIDHGSRSLYHRMQRYVFDETCGEFVPSFMSIGRTFGDFLCCTSGLTTDEAMTRLKIVGPNMISMSKPTVFHAIYKEFSKPFYVYQNFMVWTWAPYYYYYMAIVDTVVRVAGGLMSAAYQYRSDSSLHKISCVEGSVS